MKLAQHKITFQDPQDIEAIALAQLGFSTKYILSCTKLTECQINYRLHKAKVAQGYEKGKSYRSEWRNGTSQAARDLQEKLLPGLRKGVKRELPKLFTRPTAEVAEAPKEQAA